MEHYKVLHVSLLLLFCYCNRYLLDHLNPSHIVTGIATASHNRSLEELKSTMEQHKSQLMDDVIIQRHFNKL